MASLNYVLSHSDVLCVLTTDSTTPTPTPPIYPTLPPYGNTNPYEGNGKPPYAVGVQWHGHGFGFGWPPFFYLPHYGYGHKVEHPYGNKEHPSDEYPILPYGHKPPPKTWASTECRFFEYDNNNNNNNNNNHIAETGC